MQAGIVDAGKRDAVARERHHVELGVLHDLEHASSSSIGFSRSSASRIGNLRDRVAAEIEPVAGAMRQRHIGRVPGHERERDADELALHRV